MLENVWGCERVRERERENAREQDEKENWKKKDKENVRRWNGDEDEEATRGKVRRDTRETDEVTSNKRIPFSI